jgi:D-alanine-D-alanine ligase-like ATP-grasp enzyme
LEVIELKIVVLAGGTSTERDVSLSSGNGVYNALKEKDMKLYSSTYS